MKHSISLPLIWFCSRVSPDYKIIRITFYNSIVFYLIHEFIIPAFLYAIADSANKWIKANKHYNKAYNSLSKCNFSSSSYSSLNCCEYNISAHIRYVDIVTESMFVKNDRMFAIIVYIVIFTKNLFKFFIFPPKQKRAYVPIDSCIFSTLFSFCPVILQYA